MNYPDHRPANIIERQTSGAASGPPKRSDRKVIATMIVIATGVVLILILFALFTDFPGQPQGNADKTQAPPEDVRK
jgi:hypothetical protein